MKKFTPHGVMAVLCLSLICSSHRAEAQLFKRLKSEVLGVANQKADQKTVNTTNQTIDEADTLLHRGIRSIFSPKKKKDKDGQPADPNGQPVQAPAEVPATDTTHHKP